MGDSFQFDVKNMARFESPLQIFGLFLCAALVAIGVIFVLNLEVDKRYENSQERSARSPKEMLVDNEDKISLFDRFRHNLGNLLSRRQKRSIGEESQKKTLEKTTKLSENLLTESLNGHKLRNVAMKVARLNPQKDQITKEILDQFCPKMVNCSLQEESELKEEIHHEFPLLSDKEENETILQFKDEPMIQTVFVCEDYGKLIQTFIFGPKNQL